MKRIAIAALGWSSGEITLAAIERVRRADVVLLETAAMGAADWLRGEGVPFRAMDRLFESAEDFDDLAAKLAEAVVSEAGDVVYLVPELADRSVAALIQRAPEAELIAGVPLGGALAAYAGADARVISASDHEAFEPRADVNTLVKAIDTRMLACEMKLKLQRAYPDAHDILLEGADGVITRATLEELDRQERYDHRLCALIPAVKELTALERYDFSALCSILKVLRGPGGCPWDREQTHESLRQNLLEEAYEAVDAIDAGDTDALYDELGDVLLQVGLHAQIGSEHGEFDISDVTTAICKKLISRHSHIFGSERAATSAEVSALWEKEKSKEKSFATRADSMRAVTRALPALMRAFKVAGKSAKVGFCAESASAALCKVREEADEVDRALSGDGDIEEELGDLLYAVASVAAQCNTNPELALNRATDKFIARFAAMEERMLADGLSLTSSTLAQLDAYWDQVKATHK